MNPVVICNEVTQRFRGKTAIQELSLGVSHSTLFGLLGPDGAGKTTLLRLLAGLLPPTCGRVEVLGLDPRRPARQLAKRVGYMPQRFCLYEELSVAENLDFISDLYGLDRNESRALIQRCLEWTGLDAFPCRRAGALSGGMKQKLALIAALLPGPEVLLLDEPTTGVDPVARSDFWELLHSLRAEGMTLLVATPFLDEAERCDRVGLLFGGRWIAEGAPDAIAAQRTEAVIRVGGCSDLYGAPQINNHPDLLGSERIGDRVDLYVRDPSRVETLVRWLEMEWGSDLSIKVRRPTLEDAFALFLREFGDHAHG